MKKNILLSKSAAWKFWWLVLKTINKPLYGSRKKPKSINLQKNRRKTEIKIYRALSWLSPDWFFLYYDHLFIQYPWMIILSFNSLPIIFSQVPTSYGWFLLSFRCKSSWIFKLFLVFFWFLYKGLCIVFETSHQNFKAALFLNNINCFHCLIIIYLCFWRFETLKKY